MLLIINLNFKTYFKASDWLEIEQNVSLIAKTEYSEAIIVGHAI